MSRDELFLTSPADKAGILGFSVGEPRAALREAELRLTQCGFAAGVTESPQSVLYERKNEHGLNETVSLSFRDDQRLEAVLVIIEGDEFTDPATAVLTTTSLVSMAKAALGAPTFELDDVSSWANEGGLEYDSACAYVGCWAPLASVDSIPNSPSEYVALVSQAPGPLTTVNVSAGSDERGRRPVLMLQVTS